MTDEEHVPGLVPEVEDLLAEGVGQPPPARSRTWRRRALRVGGLVLTVAALVFVVLEMVDVWPELVEVAEDADWRWLVVAAAVFVVGELAFALSWPVTLRFLEHPIDRTEGAAAFLVTQTAKFVPGSVWQAVGRFGAAERLGLPRRVTGSSLLLETAGLCGAALVIGGATGAVADTLRDTWDLSSALVALATVGAVVAGIVGIVAGALLARRLFAGTTPTPVVVASLWQSGVWVLWGLAASALAVAVDAPAGAVLGAFAFSWICGFVVIGAPAGLGVREVVMAAALAPSMAEADALAVTVGSRALWIVVQLGCAAAGAAVLVRRGWRLRSLTSTDEDPSDVPTADGSSSLLGATV